MLSIIPEKNKEIENNINKKIFTCIENEKSFIFDAGAGSGKTYSLIEGLKYLISKKGESLKYHNNNAICITFTNVAAEEIKQRLGRSSLVIVSTIHDRMWDIIQHYQPQLVAIHFNKLKIEIAKIEDKISNDKNFVNYQALPSDKKDAFIEVMLNNKKSFYEVYDEPAAEIKAAFSEKLRGYDSILKNITNFKKITTSLFRLDNYRKCVKAIEQKQRRYDNVVYDARYNNDALHKMRISHDTLLEYAREIVLKYDALKQIIIDKYPYIFVDEYQDTSMVREELVQAIRLKTHAYVTVVGDDFQSIYRFSGCDLNNFLDFKKNFKPAQELYINHTYRNSKELIRVAGSFIMKNPRQMRKKLKSDKSIKKPIIICYYKKKKEDFYKLLKRIQPSNLMILGRNNKDIYTVLPDQLKIDNNRILQPNANIYYKTIHKAKGLEEDNVLIINLTSDIHSLPSKMKDEKILKYVIKHYDTFPFEEERRLFYVALTRTKNYCYLFVPKDNPSIFVSELIKNYKEYISFIHL